MLRALLKKILRPSQLRLITCYRTLAAFLPAKLFYLFTFLPFYLFNVRNENILINLTIVLMGSKAERNSHQIARIEFALSRIPQHCRSVLVLILATHLLQHDVALHHLSVFTLLTLYSERLALLHHSHNFCFHNKKKQDLAFLFRLIS